MKNVRRKHAQQKRSRETVEAIIKGAELLLIESGYAAFSTRALAARTGISVGSMYQYFANKEEVLDELLNKVFRKQKRTLTRVVGTSVSLSLELTVKKIIAGMARSFLEQRDLIVVLRTEVSDQRMQQRLREEQSRVEGYIAGTLDFISQFSILDKKTVAFVLFRAIDGVILALAQDDSLDPVKVINEAAQMVTVYLRDLRSRQLEEN